MSVTTAPPRTPPDIARPSPRQANQPRRRSLPLVATGVLCAFAGALVFTVAYLGAGHRAQVLVIAHAVPAGSTITDRDLGSALVSTSPGLGVVPVAQRSSVVGRVASVPLVAGSLLSPGQFGPGPALGPDQAVVAVALKDGTVPAGLASGDQVMVVDTGSSPVAPSAAAESGSVLVAQAVVFAVPTAKQTSQIDTGTVSISVVIPAADAPAVAAASAAGQAGLVLLGAGQ